MLVNHVLLSPDGQSLAMTRWVSDFGNWRGRVEVWNTTVPGQRRWQSPVQPVLMEAIAYSSDGRTLFSCCGTDRNGEAALWDVATGRRLQALAVLKALHGSRVTKALFHPDGQALLLACTDGRARLWDLAMDSEINPERPMAHTSAVTACAFDAQGRRALTGCRDGTVHLWDVSTRRSLLEPLRHPAQLSAVAFSPDGATLLTSSLDGTARFWDAVTGKPLAAPLRQPGGIMTLAFRPDGLRVVTTGRDATLRQWLTPPSPLDGDPELLRLWVEVQCGLELDPQGAVRSLAPEDIEERRRRLQVEGSVALPSS
jgi:WD40 repeat protein